MFPSILCATDLSPRSEEALRAAGQQGQAVVLTVMGSNGRDNLMDHILGAGAEHVVRSATMPVLVIPHVTN